MNQNSVSYGKMSGQQGADGSTALKNTSETDGPGGRLAIYIDLANVEKGSDIDPRYARIDYEQMFNILAEGYVYCGGYAFVANGGPFLEYQSSCKDLQRFGISIDREGYYDPNTKGQKGVDESMCVNAVIGAFNDEYDTIILVTGDADILPAAKKIRDRGKKVKFASFSGSLNKRILKKGYEVILLDKFPMIEFVDRSDDFKSPLEEVTVHV